MNVKPAMETLRLPFQPPRPRTFPITLGKTGACALPSDVPPRGLPPIERFASQLPDAVMLLDAPAGGDGEVTVVSINPAFEGIFGYTPPEVLGKSPGFLHGPKTDPKVHAEILRAIRSRGTLSRNLVHYDRKGRALHVALSVFPVHDEVGRCFAVAVLQRLVIEPAEQGEEARLSGERFSQAFEYGPIGMALIAPDGHWLTVNRKLCELIGYTPEELCHTTFQRLTHPEDLLGELELTARMLKGEITHYEIEKRYLHKAGHTVWIHLTVSLVRDMEGHPLYFIKQVQNITERKAMESQLMRAQRMESIGTLAGGIAHDLNNILTPILMSIEMLKQTSTHPRALTIIDTIEAISRRGAEIVRQVLSFARGMKGDHVEVQPRHLLRDIQALIKETLPKNIQLHYSFPHECWTIRGDPTQLHQIVMNLCVNARDAMPDGGRLTVTTENAVIDAQYASMHLEAKPGKYVAISVGDTGTGILPGVLDKIFEPFFTTKEIGKGTGLGLSMVMAIVKSHGGFLDVASDLGKGSTFKVFLPAVEASTLQPELTKEGTSLPRGHGETILLIDDEASILLMTSETLQAFGYKTLTASDGAEAIAIYAERRADIAAVITDMTMPVMDGKATVRVLVRINPKVRVIAASGLKTTPAIAKEAQLEIKAFLDKPYSAATLLTTLQSVLREEEA